MIREYAEHCRANLRGLNSDIRFTEAHPELVRLCASRFKVDTFTVIRTLAFEKSNACAVCGGPCFYKGSSGPLRTCSLKCNGDLKNGKPSPKGLNETEKVSNKALLKFFSVLRKDSLEDYELLESIVKENLKRDPRTVMYEIEKIFPDIRSDLESYGSPVFVITTFLLGKLNKCIECGSPTSVKKGFTQGWVRFAEYCKSECANASETKKVKTENTCLVKYGVRNPGMYPEFIAKALDKSAVAGVTTKVWTDNQRVEHNVRGYEHITNSYLQDKLGASEFVTAGLPFLPYKGSKFRTYLPDAICTIGGQKVLIETKGDYYLSAGLQDNLAKFEAARRWCKSRKTPIRFWLCVARPKTGQVKILKSPSTKAVLAFIQKSKR